MSPKLTHFVEDLHPTLQEDVHKYNPTTLLDATLYMKRTSDFSSATRSLFKDQPASNS